MGSQVCVLFNIATLSTQIAETQFELEFDVDPLFKKTSSQFDGGCNQFLATLLVRWVLMVLDVVWI
jgi:hypothetical protein